VAAAVRARGGARSARRNRVRRRATGRQREHAPDASGERIATAKSGERLEVIERVRDEVHVQLAGGKDGWIRASYLSADEPLRPRLAASTAEVARLKEELAGCRRSSTRRAPPRARRPAGRCRSAPPPAASAEDSASAPQGALFAGAVQETIPGAVAVALAAVLLALCVGFVLGALVLDRHIRRKYGGLRIY